MNQITRMSFRLFQISAVLICFLSIPTPCLPQNKTENNCRVYLSFSNNSFEISGGFSQFYKISRHYSLFSQECNSFMNFIFMNTVLKKYLFEENKNPCNIFYESFFKRCRCDSAYTLYVYNPPVVINAPIKKEEFNKELFDASLLEIRDSAIKALKKAYPMYSVKIEINAAIRTVDEQEKYLETGASKTLLSAHILGAAADFSIYFNERLIDPAPGAKDLFKNSEPYQILGKFILNKGYFWGIPWDPGHIQIKRKIQDILLEYPELQKNENLIAIYSSIIKSDSIPLKYKPVIDLLDLKLGFKENRNYDLSKPWVDDSLMSPITVDSLFKPSCFY